MKMMAKPILLFIFFVQAVYGNSDDHLSITLHPPTSTVDDVSQLIAKDEARLDYLSNLAVAPTTPHRHHATRAPHRHHARTVGKRGSSRSYAPIASGRQILHSSNYVVRVSLGTPAQSLLVALDTSNDAAWVPCAECVGCATATAFFTSAKSTTFNPIRCTDVRCKQVPNPVCDRLSNRCSFNMSYGQSSFEAVVSKETLRIAGDEFPGYTMGCIKKATQNSLPPQGLLGFGRGPLSFLSQTQSTYKSVFSYCLPAFKSPNFSGSLRLGPKHQPIHIKYTPLLSNPRRSSLYYVNMIGVRVGRRVVDIPPRSLAFNPSTGGGTVIDSGTMFTRLVEPAYIAVRDAFRRRMRGKTVRSLGGFDTCYNGAISPPTITLMFTGMNVTLPLDNMLIHSTAGSITCLAMAASPTDTNNVNGVLNVIANMQQQNHRVVFDVHNKRIGFARELCTSP